MNITSPNIGEFNLSAWGMHDHGGAGTYYVFDPEDWDEFDLDGGKFGSTTNFIRRWKKGYEGKGMGGLIVHNWHRFGGEAIGIVEANIKSCFSLLEDSFKDKGGVTNFMKDASIYECADWEKKEGGGFSFFYVLLLNYLFNDPDGAAANKYGVTKNLHIRHLEIALQYLYNISNGAMYEQLHFPVFDEFIIPNYEIVEAATERLLKKIEGIEFGIGTNRKMLKFIREAIRVSWEPGHTFNSMEELGRKLEVIFGGTQRSDLSAMSADEIDRHLASGDQSHLTEDISEQDLNSVIDIIGLIQLIFAQDNDDQSRELHLSVTEMLYDLALNKVASKVIGFWGDPYGEDRPDENDAFNPKNLDHEKAREDHLETIENLIETVNACEEKGTVYVSLMVSTLDLFMRHIRR